jgi:hypothetical protein
MAVPKKSKPLSADDLGEPLPLEKKVEAKKVLTQAQKDLYHWIQSTKELLKVADVEIGLIIESKKPVDAMLNLADAFDKLAVRCTREAILQKEAKGHQPINPLVEITAANIASALKGTARDLEAQMGLPKTWEEVGERLSNQVKVAKAVQLLISQTGISGAVSQPGTPLMDPEGKPLTETTEAQS